MKSAFRVRATMWHCVALGTAFAVAGCGGGGTSSPSPGSVPTMTPTTAPQGVVSVSGNLLFRNGLAWTPHGVQLVAFVAPPSAQTGAFVAAYAHYSTAELDAIKAWGADTIRFQLSQPGADPQDPLYDAAFVAKYVGAVKYARSIGLAAIVSIQDEPMSGEQNGSARLPNAATDRV